MKILWIVNTMFPYPAEKLKIKSTVFGGWLNSLAEQMSEMPDIELAICCMHKTDSLKIFDKDKIKYYVIPENLPLKYNKKLEKSFKQIQEDFNPDVVHIHGTEYSQGLAYINACTNKNVIISIQGMVSVYVDVFTGNINNKDIIKNITFRDIIKGSILRDRKSFEQRGKYEIEMIKKSDNVIGRTTWDYSNTKAINKNIRYYKCNESLRQNFYNDIWDEKKMVPQTIFVSQGNYPIKGLHYMIKALNIVRESYPGVILKVAGGNIIKADNIKEKLKLTGYGKYIKRLISKYKLEENIKFLGVLNAEGMKNEILKSNVFVSPSVIENSSNSLGEAMLIGIPCIASNTGGTCDILEHKEEGYLYPYTEYAVLAEYISRIFEGNEETKQFGQKSRKTAIARHDRVENAKQMLNIYNKVIENCEK